MPLGMPIAPPNGVIAAPKPVPEAISTEGAPGSVEK